MRVLVPIFVLALAAAACGDDGGDDSGGDSGGGGSGDGELSEFDLGGVDITVGSKDFVEQQVLGYIQLEALQAAGANTSDSVNLGGTNVAREALLAGEIDVYAEYNGTGWTNHLGNEEPPVDNPEELTEAVATQDLEQNGIYWIGRAPFNDTYGFAVSADFQEETGVESLEDMANYLEENPDATVCLESEYPERPDGLVLFEEAYGVEVNDFQTLDFGVIYNETASGGCDFGEIFTTDGRIAALDLQVLEDPGVHVIYNVSMNVRDEVVEEVGLETLEEIAALILDPLDDETMAALNARVAVDGEEPQDVARDYLQDEGLI